MRGVAGDVSPAEGGDTASRPCLPRVAPLRAPAAISFQPPSPTEEEQAVASHPSSSKERAGRASSWDLAFRRRVDRVKLSRWLLTPTLASRVDPFLVAREGFVWIAPDAR